MPKTFDDLAALMDRLRSPEGCPWDREQTYTTLAPMLLEEVYETFEAVEYAREGRPGELCDELGDLLLSACSSSELPPHLSTLADNFKVHQRHIYQVCR